MIFQQKQFSMTFWPTKFIIKTHDFPGLENEITILWLSRFSTTCIKPSGHVEQNLQFLIIEACTLKEKT